jgi:hypothetical protein
VDECVIPCLARALRGGAGAAARRRALLVVAVGQLEVAEV